VKKNKGIFFLSFLFIYCSAQQKKALVSTPVVNFWKEPVDVIQKNEPPLLEKDVPLLKSQLLYGERVFLVEEKGNWVKVQTTEQLVSDDEGRTWRGLCGWVEKDKIMYVEHFPSYNVVINVAWAPIYKDTLAEKALIDLSVGTLLSSCKMIDQKWYMVKLIDGSYGYIDKNYVYPFSLQKTPSQCQLSVLLGEYSKIFLGDPYCWSGRSAYCANKCFITGIDCSGLVELAYRMFGFHIPRFAHYQYLKAKPIEPKNLKVGDLLFTKYKNSNWTRVTHVLTYLGDGMLIESTGKPGIEKVRTISFQEAFGVSQDRAKNGEIYNDKMLECGSFFIDQVSIEDMRLRCIGLEV